MSQEQIETPDIQDLMEDAWDIWPELWLDSCFT